MKVFMSDQKEVPPGKKNYEIGLSYEGETPEVRRKKESFANCIIRKYQFELFDYRITISNI